MIFRRCLSKVSFELTSFFKNLLPQPKTASGRCALSSSSEWTIHEIGNEEESEKWSANHDYVVLLNPSLYCVKRCL